MELISYFLVARNFYGIVPEGFLKDKVLLLKQGKFRGGGSRIDCQY